MDPHARTAHATTLITGEFAPVFWEPLGRRGERLVAGVIVCNSAGVCRAHITLQQRQLLHFLTENRSDSALGVVDFAFRHFNKTLEVGGTIQDLKAPFARMSIGRSEAISGRSDDELTNRAIHLCTLLGKLPEPVQEDPSDLTSSRTRSFIREVRQMVMALDPKLARSALKTTQSLSVGESEIKLHFHLNHHFAQFCSLPLPNARPEAATECQARLMDLMTIRSATNGAHVALWINTAAQARTEGYRGKVNATHLVHQRTLAVAHQHSIPVREYAEPREAVAVIRETAEQAA